MTPRAVSMNAADAAVAETHTSTLFFLGDRVLKIKKPVDLGFLDFTSRASRLRACRAEVRLNRRLAPDVYLGVATLSVEGRVAENGVLMRRLPAGASLAARIRQADQDLATRVSELAQRLAEFHAHCPVIGREIPRTRYLSPAALWARNVEQLRRLPLNGSEEDVLGRVNALGTSYLEGRRPLFRSRLREGMVRDGHGDLLAEDIYLLDDGPRVLDCLEFDSRLRAVDVVLDLTSLTVDLERLGRAELADLLMREYMSVAGGRHPPTLEHFYAAYRALVRAKVSAIRRREAVPDAGERCLDLLTIALRHSRLAQPHLVLVGGLPGVGKTTVSELLARQIDGRHIASDALRDEISSAASAASATSRRSTSRYSAQMTDRVYHQLLYRAADLLRRGEHVVVDASWSRQCWRAAARETADLTRATLAEILLATPENVAAERLQRRTKASGASEADLTVRRWMSRRFEDWPEAKRIDGSSSPRRVADAVVRDVVGSDGRHWEVA